MGELLPTGASTTTTVSPPATEDDGQSTKPVMDSDVLLAHTIVCRVAVVPGWRPGPWAASSATLDGDQSAAFLALLRRRGGL